MGCKKGGFISIQRNDLQDLTANMILEVCKDSEIEPNLLPLSGEELHVITLNNSNKAKTDTRVHGSEFNLRVFDLISCRYCNKTLQQCYVMKEQEKKRTCNERILQIDHSTAQNLWCFQSTSVYKESAKMLLAFS